MSIITKEEAWSNGCGARWKVKGVPDDAEVHTTKNGERMGICDACGLLSEPIVVDVVPNTSSSVPASWG